jgi:fatty-acyl-CoA synthase
VESYDVGSRTLSLLEETVGVRFERTVSARPDREALVEVSSDRRWTWAELNTAANDSARGLLALGI